MGSDTAARVDALRARRAQIDAQLLQLEARSKVQARKDDTRRKILAGAVLLGEMAQNANLDRWARQLLNKRLVRPRDRALFNLDNTGAE